MFKLLEDISCLKPVSRLGVTDFRVVLIGQVAGGKSSCINTLLSAFAERISQRASSGCGRTGITTSFTPYPLKSSSGSSADIRLYDTPGFTETSGLDLIDFNYILEGHISDHYMFHSSIHITWKSEKFVLKPTMSHRIHCGAIVIDASTVDALTKENTEKLKALKALFDAKGIPCVVLLTKIDKVAPELEENWRSTFKNQEIKECVDKAATAIGISRNNVHPVKNYEIELEVDEDLNVLSLLALRQIIHLSMDHMENVILREDGNAVSESAEAVGSDTA
ncbi:interferon-induced protein 44-like isoform X1 [Mya arenaria]|uniref:interferon-induced protein 44-like isoform X1 n=1 Tax=Mya arenaria TaxID=6604 RepID=UPI0022E25E72|nr:interferon-induced protein 44-like isoform X1 [Mya arenaria]